MAIRIFTKLTVGNANVTYYDTTTARTNTIDIPYDLATTSTLNGPQLAATLDQLICDAVNQDNSSPGVATVVDIIR